ncbi:hypothetical protein BG004_006457 [Podila humilis]|nr:hypothetical protein BG004_006457 [Podila humilis]
MAPKSYKHGLNEAAWVFMLPVVDYLLDGQIELSLIQAVLKINAFLWCADDYDTDQVLGIIHKTRDYNLFNHPKISAEWRLRLEFLFIRSMVAMYNQHIGFIPQELEKMVLMRMHDTFYEFYFYMIWCVRGSKTIQVAPEQESMLRDVVLSGCIVNDLVSYEKEMRSETGYVLNIYTRPDINCILTNAKFDAIEKTFDAIEQDDTDLFMSTLNAIHRANLYVHLTDMPRYTKE